VSRLTNTSPFDEDEEQQDIRQRIIKRTILWAQLEEHTPALSANVRDLVRRLLETYPSQRLSLTSALAHPWLDGYVPAYVQKLPPDDPVHAQRALSPSQDSASSTGVTHIPGAYPRKRPPSVDGDGDSDMADPAAVGGKRRRAASPRKRRSPLDAEDDERTPRRSGRARK
jgi:serine/threonine protein kinase